jgi:hypothetical protein
MSERFTKVASMNSGRWYPTLVTLASGRVFCASGINNQGNDVDFNPEIFSEVGWTSFSHPTSKLPTYPQLFLLENGSICQGAYTDFARFVLETNPGGGGARVVCGSTQP